MSKTTAAPAPDAQLAVDVDAHAALGAQEITLGTLTLTVRPMKVRQVFPFLALARPLFAALANKPASPASGPSTPAAGPGQGSVPPQTELERAAPQLASALGDFEWIMDTLEKHGPQVIKALAVGVDCGEEALGELEVVHLVVLFKHFVVVNASFFTAQGLTVPQTLPAGLPGMLTGLGGGGAASPSPAPQV